MPADPEDLRVLLQKIRFDATAIQAKVTDALDLLARLNVPTAPPAHACEVCGVGKSSEGALRDHLAVVHGIDVLGAAEAALSEAESILPDVAA